jgi:hypothetical protein
VQHPAYWQSERQFQCSCNMYGNNLHLKQRNEGFYRAKGEIMHEFWVDGICQGHVAVCVETCP